MNLKTRYASVALETAAPVYQRNRISVMLSIDAVAPKKWKSNHKKVSCAPRAGHYQPVTKSLYIPS